MKVALLSFQKSLQDIKNMMAEERLEDIEWLLQSRMRVWHSIVTTLLEDKDKGVEAQLSDLKILEAMQQMAGMELD